MPSQRALPLAIAAYGLFLLSLSGLVLFLHDLWLPWTAGTGELSGGWGRTLAINTGLIALFGLQHSIMARPAFKQRWTRLVPEHLERSAYVAATMGDRVVQFDTRTFELLRSLDVGGEPDGLGSTPVIPRALCHGCTPLESPK